MIGLDEKFQSPLFFSLIFHASKWKKSLSSSFPFSIFSSSPYLVSTLPSTTYMWLSKRHQLFWMLLFLLSRVWFVREDSQVTRLTTIALISISPSVTNYHIACSLIHVLDMQVADNKLGFQLLWLPWLLRQCDIVWVQTPNPIWFWISINLLACLSTSTCQRFWRN